MELKIYEVLLETVLTQDTKRYLLDFKVEFIWFPSGKPSNNISD